MCSLWWQGSCKDLDGRNPNSMEVRQMKKQWHRHIPTKFSVEVHCYMKKAGNPRWENKKHVVCCNERWYRTMKDFLKVSSDVKLVDKWCFEKGCKPAAWANEISSIVKEFSSNNEQECTFCIVANHIALNETEQLKMFTGRMGRTGKSQVLKILMKFFQKRNETHHFVVVVLTGNVASLLGDSTYHHMFGINDQQCVMNNQLSVLRNWLTTVDYVFFDEVSMLSCRDLFYISEHLSLISNCDDTFGSMNMMFTGDITQLPPVIGHKNASLYSH